MVSVWGKNLDDEIYLTRLFDLSGNPLVAHKVIALGRPGPTAWRRGSISEAMVETSHAAAVEAARRAWS